MRQASPYTTASWMFLGPTNISGRATDIAVADHNGQRRIYAGYATGGVWKTDDNGASWQAIFEHMPSTSIGDLAVAPSNPDIVWVGTGEANIFRASMPGVGIYKSTDAGRDVAAHGPHRHPDDRAHRRPSDEPGHRLRRRVRPRMDGQRRCAACSRRRTAAGRGRRFCYKSPRTGAIDLVMDPQDPNTLYAAMWQRIRRKWSDPRVEPGYNEGGVFKTTDAGPHVDGGQSGSAGARSSAAASGSTSRDRIRTCSTRSWTTTRSAACPRRASATRTTGRCPPARASSRARTSIDPTTRARRGARRAGSIRRHRRTSTTTPARTAGCSVRFASIPISRTSSTRSASA